SVRRGSRGTGSQRRCSPRLRLPFRSDGWPWALGALAILEFLVGLRKMWRFGSRPLSTDADWRLTASPPSPGERRGEVIVAIATIGVAAVLGAGVMGVMAWKFWEVAVARLR